MMLLVVAALVWIGVHVGLAGTRLRDTLVQHLGEVPFRGVFSVLSLAAIIFLVRSWSMAPTEPLWVAPIWLRWILVIVMLPAFLLFVASVRTSNPTSVGAMLQAPRGIIRVTRHPMLCSLAIWAVVHIIGNGDLAAILFFGAFLVTALAGMPSIDAKLARRDPSGWQAVSAATSIVPFGAIAAGRNRLVVDEIGWLTALIAVVLWLVVVRLHPLVLGVAPVPM